MFSGLSGSPLLVICDKANDEPVLVIDVIVKPTWYVR